MYPLLDKLAAPGNQLYILGDLFDQWLRDSIDIPCHRTTVEKLAQASTQGLEIFCQHGNRDFMLGDDFFNATGITLLPDPHPLQLDNRAIIISHGDTLCTDDKSYQRARKVLQHPLTKNLFQSLPASWLKWLAQKIRKRADYAKYNKPEAIMDTNPQAIAQVMQDCDLLIHGHTHRPKIHQHPYGDRYVLGDWQHHCMVLVYTQQQFSLLPYEEALALLA